jgi:hypothetical protein
VTSSRPTLFIYPNTTPKVAQNHTKSAERCPFIPDAKLGVILSGYNAQPGQKAYHRVCQNNQAKTNSTIDQYPPTQNGEIYCQKEDNHDAKKQTDTSIKPLTGLCFYSKYK